MADSTLKFGQQLSIPAWKQKTGATVISIIRNPKNGNVFWSSDSGLQGDIFGDWQICDQMVEVFDQDGNHLFWALQPKRVDNVIATL